VIVRAEYGAGRSAYVQLRHLEVPTVVRAGADLFLGQLKSERFGYPRAGAGRLNHESAPSTPAIRFCYAGSSIRAIP
jgi:hypothetical protein